MALADDRAAGDAGAGEPAGPPGRGRRRRAAAGRVGRGAGDRAGADRGRDLRPGEGPDADPPGRAVLNSAGPGGVLPPVLLGFVGCMAILAAAAMRPNRAYLEAERATAAAIEPEYLGYVEADTALTPEQKQRRRNTVETAELRRRAATRAAILTQAQTGR